MSLHVISRVVVVRPCRTPGKIAPTMVPKRPRALPANNNDPPAVPVSISWRHMVASGGLPAYYRRVNLLTFSGRTVSTRHLERPGPCTSLEGIKQATPNLLGFSNFVSAKFTNCLWASAGLFGLFGLFVLFGVAGDGSNGTEHGAAFGGQDQRAGGSAERRR
jgi:hypothetical protein